MLSSGPMAGLAGFLPCRTPGYVFFAMDGRRIALVVLFVAALADVSARIGPFPFSSLLKVGSNQKKCKGKQKKQGQHRESFHVLPPSVSYKLYECLDVVN
jgi:hypothetical protein